MGFSTFKPPEYLYQTKTGLFIFRMIVPVDCQPVLHKIEFRYSLKTRCIRTARQYLASIPSDLEGLFKKKKLFKEWSHKTEEEHEQVFKLFIKIMGDVDILRQRGKDRDGYRNQVSKWYQRFLKTFCSQRHKELLFIFDILSLPRKHKQIDLLMITNWTVTQSIVRP